MTLPLTELNKMIEGVNDPEMRFESATPSIESSTLEVLKRWHLLRYRMR